MSLFQFLAETYRTGGPMFMGIVSIFGLLMLFIISCEVKYDYWEISKFKIDNTALEDEEEIKIIYTSRGPDYNREYKYYIHLIAISQKTGKKVNILTTAVNEITIEDKDKVFNFFNQDNIGTKLLQMDLEHIKNIEDIDKAEFKNIYMVARDPRFDHIADNNYPTIIGSIGTISNINE